MAKKSPSENASEARGRRLRDFLRGRFKTVSAAAEAYGKVGSYFNNYLNGQSVPGGEVLGWLASQGCNLNWLLTGEGDMLLSPHDHSPPQTHEPGPRYVGDIEAGLPPTVMDPKTNQVIIGKVLQTATTILTTEGKHVLVIEQRAKG